MVSPERVAGWDSMGCGSPVTPAAAGVQQIRTVFGVTRGLPGRSPACAAATTLAGWQRVQLCCALHLPEVAVEVLRQPRGLVRVHPREIDL